VHRELAERLVERVLDLLARLSAHPAAPFERLLARLARTVGSGTTLLVLTTRDPAPFVPWLRRIEAAGSRVLVVACGPSGVADARRARQLGLAARSVRLDGPWRTAAAIAVTG
jgi:hypothetical protein